MDNGEVIQVGNIVDDTLIGFKNPQRGRIYSTKGLAPCLNCCGGGGLEPKIICNVIDMKAVSYTRDRDGKTVNKHLNDVVNTIHSSTGSGGNTDCFVKTTKSRIRKLTPRECFRLMGVDDADIDKIQASGISNSQQYKCAGNSIVVDTLYHLFRKMFCETENENTQPTLF